MDRGTWLSKVHGVTKELDMTEQLNNYNNAIIGYIFNTVNQFFVTLTLNIPQIKYF